MARSKQMHHSAGQDRGGESVGGLLDQGQLFRHPVENLSATIQVFECHGPWWYRLASSGKRSFPEGVCGPSDSRRRSKAQRLTPPQLNRSRPE